MSQEVHHIPSREDHEFGHGTYTFPYNTEALSPEQQREITLLLAWSHGCPIPNQVIAQFGIDSALSRYSNVNGWFRRLIAEATLTNVNLRYLLLHPISRHLPEETVGKYERANVPLTHLWQISPMSHIWGYATPRILIELGKIDQKKGVPGAQTPQRLLLEYVYTSTHPRQLLARLSEAAFVRDYTQAREILSHAYARNILEEEGTVTEFAELAKSFDQFAPNLWRTYQTLTSQEKEESTIAEVPVLKAPLAE